MATALHVYELVLMERCETTTNDHDGVEETTVHATWFS